MSRERVREDEDEDQDEPQLPSQKGRKMRNRNHTRTIQGVGELFVEKDTKDTAPYLGQVLHLYHSLDWPN